MWPVRLREEEIHLPDEMAKRPERDWCGTLPVLARHTRRGLLSHLWALEPVIAALGGAATVAEAFRAIEDVGQWWE
ncbi:MAG TPA: hypothetical protein EYH31_08980 [Anaerolineae bacterium]|nr:hypothetical protein [Anaerolineae bacterium]